MDENAFNIPHFKQFDRIFDCTSKQNNGLNHNSYQDFCCPSLLFSISVMFSSIRYSLGIPHVGFPTKLESRLWAWSLRKHRMPIKMSRSTALSIPSSATKVTDPISDFTFLSAAKSGKPSIKNLFLIRRYDSLLCFTYQKSFELLIEAFSLGLLWDLKSPKVGQSRLKSPKIALSCLKSP